MRGELAQAFSLGFMRVFCPKIVENCINSGADTLQTSKAAEAELASDSKDRLGSFTYLVALTAFSCPIVTIEAQYSVALAEFAIAPKFSELLARIEMLVVLGNDLGAWLQQTGSRKQL
jgi:hypothetical protein